MIISANELKTKGISVLDSMLKNLEEVVVSVRGKNKYVVVDMERYEYLRECELEHAYREVQKDMKDNRYKTQTAEEHMTELKNVLQD